MRIIKNATCSSSSGKSQITYHIGISKDKEIFLRVYANSGNGYFSSEWVSIHCIQDALEQGHKPLTSFALQALYLGKSVNTPAFLMVAIENEGLIQHDPENPRCYVCLDPINWVAAINELAATKVDLKAETSKAVLKKNTSRKSPNIVKTPT